MNGLPLEPTTGWPDCGATAASARVRRRLRTPHHHPTKIASVVRAKRGRPAVRDFHRSTRPRGPDGPASASLPGGIAEHGTRTTTAPTAIPRTRDSESGRTERRRDIGTCLAARQDGVPRGPNATTGEATSASLCGHGEVNPRIEGEATMDLTVPDVTLLAATVGDSSAVRRGVLGSGLHHDAGPVGRQRKRKVG